MKENRYDRIIAKLVERNKRVQAKIGAQFKKTAPFRMTPVSEEEMLYKYDQITPEEMDGYIQNYGEEAVNDMIYNFETLKTKKQGGGGYGGSD